jgi:hypothetical protein
MARIKDPQAKKRPPARRYSRLKSSVHSSVHSYKVVGDPAQVLREIPDGVLVALVPPDATTEKKLLRIGSGRIQRFRPSLCPGQIRRNQEKTRC